MTLLSRILDFLLPQRAWDRHVSRVIAEFYEEVGPVETWNSYTNREWGTSIAITPEPPPPSCYIWRDPSVLWSEDDG